MASLSTCIHQLGTSKTRPCLQPRLGNLKNKWQRGEKRCLSYMELKVSPALPCIASKSAIREISLIAHWAPYEFYCMNGIVQIKILSHWSLYFYGQDWIDIIRETLTLGRRPVNSRLESGTCILSWALERVFWGYGAWAHETRAFDRPWEDCTRVKSGTKIQSSSKIREANFLAREA